MAEMVNKVINYMIVLIVFGALAATGFGYLTNITSALSDYAWAATLITLGIVVGAVKMFIPRN